MCRRRPQLRPSLAAHQPERIAAAHILLAPRDFIVYRMTDQLVTDATFASRSGLYDFDGNVVRELAGPALGKLPSVVPSDTVVGQLKPVPAAELGLRPGVPIVIGAEIGSAAGVACIRPQNAVVWTTPFFTGRNQKCPGICPYAEWSEAARSGVRLRQVGSCAQRAA